MVQLALAALLHLVAAPAPDAPRATAASASSDVWLAFAGDIAADDAKRLRPVTGPIAQADLAVHVSAAAHAATPTALLGEIGLDAYVRDTLTTERHTFGPGCVRVVGGPIAALGADHDAVADPSCFVVAVARWSTIDAGGMPPAAERALASALVTRGADLVVGHHPGAFGGVGWERGAPIIWSVGSLYTPDVTDVVVFRARLAHGTRGLALAELDMKPLVRDAAKGRLRTPKEKEVGAIAATAERRSRAVGGRAVLEAAHIVLRPR